MFTLITGASAGIGRELARIHAEHGDDLLLVARREKRLRDLKQELESAHGVQVHVLAEDLLDPAAPARIEAFCHEHGLEVEHLVNNAGFGGHGAFHERDRQADLDMVHLNVVALTDLTKRFLPAMVERGHGRILNLASTAGFMPGPFQAVYHATKAYVLSLSEAIAEELRGTGVTVTALCPGPVHSEFADVAGTGHLPMFKHAPSARETAEIGHKAMMDGRVVRVDTLQYRALMTSLRLLPKGLVRRSIRRVME